MRSMRFALFSLLLASAACVDVPNNGPFAVGGSVTIADGSSVTLTNNGSDSLTVSQSGPFVFATSVALGGAYDVEVPTPPNGQQCSVSNGSGSVTNANITTVLVKCVANPNYYISGTVIGLNGSVTLQSNSEQVTVNSPNNTFQFSTPLSPNETFSVKVSGQPTNQTCLFGGSDNVSGLGGPGSSGLRLTCTQALRTVSVTVTGLVGQLQLLNNGDDALTITQPGAFTFAKALIDNTVINITVASEPANQACTIPLSFGIINGGNLYNIQVICTSPTSLYKVTGVAAGINGAVTINNEGIDPITVSANGGFTFAVPMTEGSSYNAYITNAPPGEACAISTISGNTYIQSGAGTIGSQDVTTLRLNCGAGYSIGGSISGLSGTLRLLNTVNGQVGDILAKSAAGAFVFPTPLGTQSTYKVSVLSQPPAQTCTVTAANGNVTTSSISNIGVTCTNTAAAGYTVGGTVAGLTSGSVMLSNDGFDPLTVSASGAFTFPTALADKAPYNVTVTSQPASLACVVINANNTINARNITTVAVDCFSAHPVQVAVTGLSGGNVVVESTTNPTAVISSNSVFTFTGLVQDGLTVGLNVASAPPNMQCTLVNRSGTYPNIVPYIVCGPFAQFITGQNANNVVGQGDFSGTNCNTASGAVDANTVCDPYGDAWINNSNNVFFPDYLNNRVLEYNNMPTAKGVKADGVVGQTSFTAKLSSPVSANSLKTPQSVSGNSNHMVVVDTDNSRVLIYVPPVAASNAAATVALGQTNLNASLQACTATGLTAPQGAVVAAGRLIVADTGNNRVLIWNTIPTASGTAPNVVLGQPNFTTCAPNDPQAPNANTLSAPGDVWADANHLVVADTQNNRVLIWSALPTTNDYPADSILGLPNLTSYGEGTSLSDLRVPTAVTGNGQQLFVADSLNNRVLIWNQLPLLYASYANGGSTEHTTADVQLGQVNPGDANVNGNGGIAGPATLHTPSGLFISGKNLIVTDTGNNRYIIYRGF